MDLFDRYDTTTYMLNVLTLVSRNIDLKPSMVSFSFSYDPRCAAGVKG